MDEVREQLRKSLHRSHVEQVEEEGKYPNLYKARLVSITSLNLRD